MALTLLGIIGEVTACTRNGGTLTVCFDTRTVRIASREEVYKMAYPFKSNSM